MVKLPLLRDFERKGIGYMIEAIVAVLTLLIFVLGNTGSTPSQDWTQFQNEIAANDLGYVLKQTGDMENFLRRHESGSLRTATDVLTSGALSTSGHVENLPAHRGQIGFHVTPAGVHTDTLQDVTSGDRCYNDLEEIDNQAGTTVKKSTRQRDNVPIYVADTGSEVSTGYDALWVDNGTRCQFSAAEGPFYVDEFFKWINDSSADYGYYDLKNIDASSNSVTYYNASQAVRIRDTVGGKLNGIQLEQNYDTFRLGTDDISVYRIIVFRKNAALNQINANQDKLENYMSDGSVLLLMNLTKNDFDSGFLTSTGLRWVGLPFEDSPSSAKFGDSTIAEETKTYFRGLEGQEENINLVPGGNISSSNSDKLLEEQPLLYSVKGTYDTDVWNASDFNMNPVPASSVNGEPDSECYEQNTATNALTEGTLTFEDAGTFDIINTELGQSQTYCNNRDVRAINIDFNGVSGFNDEGEGPFLNGEEIEVGGRKYRIKIYPSSPTRDEGEAAEAVYSGDPRVELINYRTSFDFPGEKLARAGYEARYSEADRRAIGSVLYWLLGDQVSFGSQDSSTITTQVYGSVKEETYMPYKLILRWSE